MTEETIDGNHGNIDDYHVFSIRDGVAQNTVEMLIEDKPVNIVIDSGANCNLKLERIFEFVTGCNASLLDCNMTIYAYASNKPLQLRG